MINYIATVGVYVDDQDAAEKFWTEKVGFEVKKKDSMGPNANWLEIGPKDAQSNLVVYPRSMMKNWAELKPSIVFVCENFEETYSKLKNKGVEFIDEPQKMQWGTFVKFKERDGNEFLLKG